MGRSPMGLIKRIIPSMFHRRLALMGVLMVVPFVLLSGRLGWMTLVKGADARAVAEARLVNRVWLPTVRGRILDRQGRVLAMDRPSYDIAVSYKVLTGEWARVSGERFARKVHKDVWATLNADERAELSARYTEAYENRVEQMWSLVAQGAGVSRDEIDEACRAVIRRVEGVEASVMRLRTEAERAKLIKAGIKIGPAEEARIASIARAPISEVNQAHPIVRGVSDEIGFRFMRMTEREAPLFSAGIIGEAALDEHPPMLPGLSVIDATTRVYPFETMRVEIDRSTLPKPIRGDGAVQIEIGDVAGLLLGSMRRGIYREDVVERSRRLETDPDLRARALLPSGVDTGEYMPSDLVGHTGLESALEDRLRGLRGIRTENLQTLAVEERSKIVGMDVRLTLDIQLQARVRAVLDPALGLTTVQAWHQNHDLPIGTELDAAAVVVDVANGEILAMVSMPEPPRDGDWSRRGLSGEELDRYLALHAPYINRAYGKPYQPGSIVKALILCGAIKAGEYTPGERIRDNGHYFPNQPNAFRSWIYKVTNGTVTHSQQLGRDPDDVDALMVSANGFFFTLADRLGASRVAQVYRDFGVGEGFGLGVGGEWPGSIGGLTDGVNDGSDLSRQDTILLGIGQGPITWTPLHAADAFATIARGGVRIVPRLISEEGAAPSVVDLKIPARAIRDTLEGLHRSVSDPGFGTGYDFAVEGGRDRVFNAPGVSVWGKTGTADASPVTWDPDGPDGPQPPIVVRSGDHSWYVTLVGEEGGPPRYAVAVVVDFGGSGGRVSGPIANQIVHALIQEGYLGSGARRAGGS